eukprot:7038219-Prymnesium_polylepis.1
MKLAEALPKMPNLREVRCAACAFPSHETAGYPPFSSFQPGIIVPLQFGLQPALWRLSGIWDIWRRKGNSHSMQSMRSAQRDLRRPDQEQRAEHQVSLRSIQHVQHNTPVSYTHLRAHETLMNL